MQGSFSSEQQAKKDTNFFHITLDMFPIWEDHENGKWLYVEQTAAWTPGKPYRQRVYHLTQEKDGRYRSTIYKMPTPKKYVGGFNAPQVFDSLSVDSLEVLQGCDLVFSFENGSFSGITKGKECTNTWGKATYATSEVTISKDVMLSWDRGWDDDDKQVWGAETSGYIFKKLKK